MAKEKIYAGMHNPPHPGEIISEICEDRLNLTITGTARALGVTRQTLSRLINGHFGISPEMAIKLSRALGSTPEHWLRLQARYDLWNLRDYDASDVKPLHEFMANR